MFVTKRPFRNFGKVYTAGTVIDNPAVIKRFKGKLAEGKIIEVTEQNYSGVAAYFKAKYGVDIAPIEAKPAEEVNIPKDAEEPKVTEALKESEVPKDTVKAVTTEVKKVVVAKAN